MSLRRHVPLLLAPLALGGCGWFGGDAGNEAAAPDRIEVANAAQGQDIVTVDADSAAAKAADVTPMAERVAVLGLLNKRNGEARDITLKPGQAVRAGDVVIRLQACEKTAPWETDQYTGAFAQVDVRGTDGQVRRVFSGWLFKERPGLNVVQHPIYDVWVKSCAMTFPETGGEVVTPVRGSDSAAASRSSAPKSAATPAEPDASPAEPSPSASDNSDR